MAGLKDTLKVEDALIGMVHVPALPGTPYSHLSLAEIIDVATDEARRLDDLGFNALIVENMHDRPYIHGNHGPETVACMTAVVRAIREEVQIPLGVQILSGGNKEAIAVAHAAGAQFIRCENFVFAHVADEGLLAKAEAGELLRYRKSIGAEQVRVMCDIKKKHASHAITADISITDAAEAAAFFGADGLIVTGAATGKPADPKEVAAVAKATKLPVLVGSGVTPQSIKTLLAHAQGVIVGSYLKKDGLWSNPLDMTRCTKIIDAFGKATE